MNIRSNNYPSFRRAFSDTAIITLVNALMGIITAIFLARHLGPSSRGDLAIIVASVTILSSLSDIYQGGNEITLGRNQNLILKIFIITIMGSILFSFLLMMLLILNNNIANFLISSASYELKIITSIFFLQIILYDGLKRILNAKQEFFFINRIDLMHSFFYLIFLIAGILFFEIDVFGVLIVLCIVNAARLFVVFLKLYEFLKSNKNISKIYDKEWHRDFFKIGKRNFLWSTPYALIQRMSIWQIANISSNTNAGIYRVATTLTEIVLMIPRAANTITRGKAVSEEGGWIRSLYTSKLILLFGFTCTLLFALTGWFLVPFIFGYEYILVYKLGIILMLAVSFLGNVFVLEAQIVSKEKFPKNVIFINYICLIILFILNILLIPLGILFAGISFLITSFTLYLLYNLIFAHYSCVKKRDIFFISNDEIIFIKELFRTYIKRH